MNYTLGSTVLDLLDKPGYLLPVSFLNSFLPQESILVIVMLEHAGVVPTPLVTSNGTFAIIWLTYDLIPEPHAGGLLLTHILASNGLEWVLTESFFEPKI
jgi:hypothetical protein